MGAAFQIVKGDLIGIDVTASVDDEVEFDAAAIPPTVTWGITPGQGLGIDETVPSLDQLDPGERPIAEEAYRYMDLQPGTAIAGVPVDVCFICLLYTSPSPRD